MGVRRIALFCLVALGLCLGWAWPVAADFATGYVAFQAGDYKTALSELTPLAESGDKRAQYLLGFMHRDGLGVKKSAKGAFEWLSKAAAEPGPDRFALHDLGVLYERGQGTKKDVKKAAELYGAAAARGVPSAMVNLGVLLARGSGVKRDLGAALRLFYRAHEAGHPGAAEDFDRLAQAAGGDPPAAGRWRAVDYLAPADDPGLRDIESLAALSLGSELRLGRWRFSFGRLSCKRPVFVADVVAPLTLAYDLAGATIVPGLADLADESAAAGEIRTVEVICDRVVKASAVLLSEGRLLLPALGGYLVMEPAPSARVKAAQRLLREAGFAAGQADGVYGKRTAEAIRAFQASVGQPPTGALSDALIGQLEAAAPAPPNP